MRCFSVMRSSRTTLPVRALLIDSSDVTVLVNTNWLSSCCFLSATLFLFAILLQNPFREVLVVGVHQGHLELQAVHRLDHLGVATDDIVDEGCHMLRRMHDWGEDHLQL